MQTERVTFLTTPDHKAALGAYAAGTGRSGGHLVRAAATRYSAEGGADEDEALALAALASAHVDRRKLMSRSEAMIEDAARASGRQRRIEE